MENKFIIQNFRRFSEETEFDLAPITILTGTNSAGKSTLVKAILLLEDFLKKGALDKHGCRFDSYELDLEKFKLGKFKDIQNRTDYPIIFQYDVDSSITASTWTIKYQFKCNKKGVNYLDLLWIKNNEGKQLLSVDFYRGKILGVDLNLLTRDFNKYLTYQSYIHCRRHSCDAKIPQNITKDDVLSFYSRIPVMDREAAPSVVEEDYILFQRFFMDTPMDIIEEYISKKTSKNENSIMWLPLFSQLEGKCKKETVKFLCEKFDCKDISPDVERDYEDYSSDPTPFIKAFEKSEFESFEDFFNSTMKQQMVTEELNDRRFDKDFFDIIKSELEEEIVLSDCNRFLSAVSKNKEYEKWFMPQSYKVHHKLQYLFFVYLKVLLKEVLIANFVDNITYLPTNRINVHRLYTTEDAKDDFGIMLRMYRNVITKSKDYDGVFINKWLKEFQIADKLEIEETKEGTGLSVYLKQGKKKRLLADEGCGITQLVSILLNIDYCILTQKYIETIDAEKFFTVKDDNLYTLKRMPHTIIIEEPEIHLHPALQSKLADLFYEAYKEYNIHFIIETHSEYLIRKLQVLSAKKEIAKQALSIYYLYDANPYKRPKDEKQVRKIELKKDGRLEEPFGSGFFDEADRLSLDLLTLKMNLN